jgi:hypothetical protein
MYGQTECSVNQMIRKIDSVAKANGIEKAVVNVKIITTTLDKVVTETENVAKGDDFYFDGQFLVVDYHYFNLEKLLYFHIWRDSMVFCFQNF